MASEQRKQLLLALVAVVLAIVVYQLWPSPTAANSPASSNVRGAARAQPTQPAIVAPDVHLEALNEERAKPTDVERNLFRFKPKPAPPPPPVTVIKPPPPAPSGPPPAPALPPIALKLINIWELTEQKKKFAVLTDGKGGVPIYGQEGDTVEGRYKILKIGAESVEMAYLDGRGRQTIRLTGQ